MKLAVRKWFSNGFRFEEVPITLKIGTLEDVCSSFGIEFYQVGDYSKDHHYDFMVELLYQGYLTACKESFKKPKFKPFHAHFWFELMSQSAQKEFTDMLNGLMGKIQGGGSKKKVKQHGKNSGPSQ